MRKFKNRQLPKGILIDRGLVFIRIFRNGKPFQEGFGRADVPSNVNLAVAKLNEYREAIRNDKFGLERKAKRIQTSDAVELFLSKDAPLSYHYQLLGFKAFTEGLWYDVVNHLKMQGYRPFRLAAGVSESTVNRELTAISAMYYKLKTMVELCEIEPLKLPPLSPCKHVKRYDERLARRSRTVAVDELTSFLNVATPRIQRAVVGALNTALRKKDLFNLGHANKAQSSGLYEGVQSKVGNPYTVPNNANVQALFNETEGELMLDKTNFKSEFRDSREKWLALFPPEEREKRYFLFKDLRRTALRKVYDETKDILLCRDLAGHVDVRTTQGYLGLTAEDIGLAGSVLQKAFSFDLAPSETVGKTIGKQKEIGFKTA
jgi:hypothetical protein